jgi:hypothetical protein
MKRTIFFLIILFLTGATFAQTLSWRVANPRILRTGATSTNMEFDVQVKCSVPLTYLWAATIKFDLNSTTFNTTVANWNVVTVGVFGGLNSASGLKYTVSKTINGTPLRFNLILTGDPNVVGNGGNPTDFGEVPTTYTTICTIKARLAGMTTDALAGMDFYEAGMNGATAQQYLADAGTTQLNYVAPCLYDTRDFMNTYTGRMYSTAWGWSQVGGPTNNVQYNNWATSVNTTVWEDASITQTDNTAALANNLYIGNGSATVPVLTIPSNKWLTVAGTLTNPGTSANLLVANGGSLISPTAAPATVTRNIAAGEWHLIGAPTSNATSTMFQDQYLQMHNEGTNAYTDIIALGAPLVPGKGYALWSTAGPAVFAGPLNAGAVSVATTAGGQGWNLVSNPYASSINWDAASGWTKTGVNNATYVHVNAATWASYVAGVPANGGTSNIAPGQGFFVKAASGGTLGMNTAVQVHSTQSFYKNTDVVNNLVRLQVSGNGYTDEAVVRFLPEASAAFDGDYDAYKLYGDVAEAAQLYTGSEPLSINTLPETPIVPAGIHAGASGTYTIAMTELNDISQVSLEDTKTGIFTDLTKGSYTFTFTPGENEQRFFLHFGTTGVIDTQATNVSIYSYQQTAYVTMKENVKGDIFIYNVAGQLVAKRTEAQGSNEIKLLNTGIYNVKVITSERTFVQKVFIQ